MKILNLPYLRLDLYILKKNIIKNVEILIKNIKINY